MGWDKGEQMDRWERETEEEEAHNEEEAELLKLTMDKVRVFINGDFSRLDAVIATLDGSQVSAVVSAREELARAQTAVNQGNPEEATAAAARAYDILDEELTGDPRPDELADMKDDRDGKGEEEE